MLNMDQIYPQTTKANGYGIIAKQNSNDHIELGDGLINRSPGGKLLSRKGQSKLFNGFSNKSISRMSLFADGTQIQSLMNQSEQTSGNHN